MGNNMKALFDFLRWPTFRKKYKHLKSRMANLEIVVDFLINSPTYIDSEDDGYNGQAFRKIIFRDLLNEFGFEAIFETGTLAGSTAGYMAKSANVPIYTCELNERFFALAKMRLKDIPNIHFNLCDSREFLKMMSEQVDRKARIFIYLDAHWALDLPLKEEIEIICTSWDTFVIMIDDFKVPGDNGYGYDDYGRGRSLTLENFGKVFNKYGLIPFFPALSSADETCSKRGCVVLAKQGEISERLSKLQSISLRS